MKKEEKQIRKEETERYADEMSGQETEVEQDLDRELRALVDIMPDHEELEKHIEQRIKRKVQKIVLRTMAAAAAVVAALFLIISPCMDAMFINPVKLNKESNQQMLKTLNNYWEITEPYAEIVSFTARKKGFACYELEMQATDRRSPLYYGQANVWAEMRCGKYKNWQDPECLLVQRMGRFEELVCPERTEEEIQADNRALLEEIRELPRSAKIYLSIGDKTPKKLEELRTENVDLNWMEVYQPNVKFQGGLSMHRSVLLEDSDVRDNLTEDELKETYISNLKDLITHEAIWRDFGLSDSHYRYPEGAETIKLLEETCEDAGKLEVLESKNYCISGKRDDIVEYLEKTEVAHIQVDEIKLI